MPSMEFEPAPPVAVQVPADSMPSAPMGKATTLFISSLLIRYMAFPVIPPAWADCDGAQPFGAKLASERRGKVLGMIIVSDGRGETEN